MIKNRYKFKMARRKRSTNRTNQGCFKTKRRTTITIRDRDRQESHPSLCLVKFLRILLIFFYGQFFATAIYTHLIHGIPLVILNPAGFYPNMKVALGILMVIHTLFATLFIWKKNWRLIFASIVSLILLSVVTLVTAIIDLVQRNERGLLQETEFGSTAAEITVETMLRLFAVFASLMMVRKLREFSGDVSEDEESIELESKTAEDEGDKFDEYDEDDIGYTIGKQEEN